MRFNPHSNLKDLHAFLSPSNYHWMRYDDDKLVERWANAKEASLGVRKHAFAAEAINLKIKLSGSTTIARYVNDAIGYRMSPEVTLYYSDNCFGHADAICFRRNTLRIFDLKNGVTKASIDQLLVYAALFCLEYDFKPFEINYDLRIYQYDEVQRYQTDPEDVARIMEKIRDFDKKINLMRMEELA